LKKVFIIILSIMTLSIITHIITTVSIRNVAFAIMTLNAYAECLN
jgi:hypothetical protein